MILKIIFTQGTSISTTAEDGKKSDGNKNLNMFSVFSKVSGAVSKFKSLIRYKRLDNLQGNQIEIINDWSFYGTVRKSGDDEVINKEKIRNA